MDVGGLTIVSAVTIRGQPLHRMMRKASLEGVVRALGSNAWRPNPPFRVYVSVDFLSSSLWGNAEQKEDSSLLQNTNLPPSASSDYYS